MAEILEYSDLVTKGEFRKYQEETKENFTKVYSAIDKNNEKLDKVSDKVEEINLDIKGTSAKMETILTTIEMFSDNMNDKFDLIKDANADFRDNLTTKIEGHLNYEKKVIDDKIKELEKPIKNIKEKFEEEDEDDEKEKSTHTARLSIISTAITAIAVALIKIIPTLLGR